jgi:hypothetical protein
MAAIMAKYRNQYRSAAKWRINGVSASAQWQHQRHGGMAASA